MRYHAGTSHPKGQGWVSISITDARLREYVQVTGLACVSQRVQIEHVIQWRSLSVERNFGTSKFRDRTPPALTVTFRDEEACRASGGRRGWFVKGDPLLTTGSSLPLAVNSRPFIDDVPHNKRQLGGLEDWQQVEF